MSVNTTLQAVTDRIVERSKPTRTAYLERLEAAVAQGPTRAHLSCGNQAHAYAAMGADQRALVEGPSPNIGIITAYNDMLSAHQPFQDYPAPYQGGGPHGGGHGAGCGWGSSDV